MNPVSNITGIGDPFVLQHNETYYLYCTSGRRGFKVWKSSDLVNWAYLGFAFSRDDSANTFGVDRFWAPEVVFYDGRFYMTYSAGDTDGVLKLCLAVSDRPEGPFVNLRAPWYEHPLSHIDASILVDDKECYVYFVRDCSTNIIDGQKVSQIFVAMLSPDLTSFATEPRLVLAPSQPWETVAGKSLWNEGPFVLKDDGRYYLTYSANGFFTLHYGVGYATADHPFGPWEKAPENPILEYDVELGVSGPGHSCITLSPDQSEYFIVYHSHTDFEKKGGNRTVNIDRLSIRDGRLEVEGPTRSPQPYPSGSPEIIE